MSEASPTEMQSNLPENRWIALLTALDGATRAAGAWKNIDATLAGDGDLDYAATADDWDVIAWVFGKWRVHQGIPAAFVCDHRPGARYLVGLHPASDTNFWQLDVRDRVTVRGSTLFTARGVAPLMIDDTRGFRRLRPGAEAAFKLVLKCVDDTGVLVPALVAEEGVRQLIKSDADGFAAAMAFFGRAAPTIERAGMGIAEGGESGDLGPVFREFRRRAWFEPTVSAPAAVHRLWAKKRCPFLGWPAPRRGPRFTEALLGAHESVGAET